MSRGRVLHVHWFGPMYSTSPAWSSSIVLQQLWSFNCFSGLVSSQKKERGAFCMFLQYEASFLLPHSTSLPKSLRDCLAFSEEQESRKLPLDWLHDPSYCSASLWLGPHGAGRRGSTKPSKFGRWHVKTCRNTLKHDETCWDMIWRDLMSRALCSQFTLNVTSLSHFTFVAGGTGSPWWGLSWLQPRAVGCRASFEGTVLVARWPVMQRLDLVCCGSRWTLVLHGWIPEEHLVQPHHTTCTSLFACDTHAAKIDRQAGVIKIELSSQLVSLPDGSAQGQTQFPQHWLSCQLANHCQPFFGTDDRGDCLDQFLCDRAALLKQQRMTDFNASNCTDEKSVLPLGW